MSVQQDRLSAQLGQVLAVLGERPGFDAVAVMLLDAEGRLRVAGASSDAARDLERAQERAGDGPGFDALVSGRPEVVEDIVDSRWSEVLDVGPDSAVRGVLAAPIIVAGRPMGNVNVVTDRPHAWSGTDIDQARAAADAAAALLEVAANAETPEAGRGAIEVLGGRAGSDGVPVR
jgi:GAF domain-containing protein